MDISALYYALWKVFKQRIGTFALFCSRTRTIAIGERDRDRETERERLIARRLTGHCDEFQMLEDNSP